VTQRKLTAKQRHILTEMANGWALFYVSYPRQWCWLEKSGREGDTIPRYSVRALVDRGLIEAHWIQLGCRYELTEQGKQAIAVQESAS
jgi:hypothetical protein